MKSKQSKRTREMSSPGVSWSQRICMRIGLEVVGDDEGVAVDDVGDTVLIEGGAILRDSLAGDVQAVRDARAVLLEEVELRRRIWSSDSGAASSGLSRKASRFRPIGRLDPAGAPTPRLRPATPAAGLPLELAGEGSLELEGASPSPPRLRPKPGGFRAVRGVTFDPGAAPDGATAPRFSPSPSPGGFPSAGTAPARGEMDPEGSLVLPGHPHARRGDVHVRTRLDGHFAEAHGRQEVVRVRVRSGRVHVEPVAVHPTIVRVHRVARHPFGGPHARRSLRESRQSTMPNWWSCPVKLGARSCVATWTKI